MTTSKILPVLVAGILACILLSCSGGSTEIGNAHSEITGKVTENSAAAAVATVCLVKENYIPGEDTADKVFVTETDCNGTFRFSEIPLGNYYLNAEKEGKLLLDGPFDVALEQVDLAQHQLHQASVIKMAVNADDSVSAVYVKGTVHSYTVNDGSAELTLVPQGTVTIMGYDTCSVNTSTQPGTKPAITIAVSEASHMSASFSNTPPVFTAQPQNTSHVVDAASRSYSYQLSAHDPENDSVQFILLAGPAGMTVDSYTGSVTWNPDQGVASGKYSVTVVVFDVRGGANSISWDITLADGSFSLDGSVHEFQGEAGKTYMVNAGQSEGINAYRFAWGDGDTSAWQKLSSAPHSWKSTGTFLLSYQMQNSSDGGFSGWSEPVTVSILKINVDTESPILQIGDTLVYVNLGTAYVDEGYSAYDVYEERKINVTVNGSVDVNTVGTYVLTYTAEDSSHNQAVKKRTVIVVSDPGSDPERPVIVLLGPDTIYLADTVKIEEFIATFAEPGYSAIDNVDGDITTSVSVSEVNQLSPALYYIEYNVSDHAGNAALPVRRFIALPAISGPEIYLIYGDSIIEHVVNTPWIDPGFYVGGGVDVNTVIVDSSDLVFHLGTPGTYQIKYTVTDSIGLTTVKVRYVQVVSLLQNFEVPSPDPFPTVTGTWSAMVFFGDTTGLTKVKSVGILWNLEQQRLDTILFQVEGQPYILALDTVENTLADSAPTLFFNSEHSTGVEKLDTALYVRMIDDSMVWVAMDGSFAIEWKME